MRDERDHEEEPLELVPLGEGERESEGERKEPPPPAPPESAPKPEQRTEKAPDGSEAPAPPRFARSEIGAILLWPLRGHAGQNLLVAASIYAIALAAGGALGGLLSYLPILGPWLGAVARTLFAIGGILFLLEFSWHLVVATLEGNLAAQRIIGGATPREGLRLTALGAFWFAPAVIVGIGTSSPAVGSLVAVAAWALFPAAVVLAAATDRLSEGNPVTAARFVRRAGRSWLVVAGMLVPFLAARLLVGGGLLGILVEWATGILLVYAFVLAALIARDRAGVAELIIVITRAGTDESEA